MRADIHGVSAERTRTGISNPTRTLVVSDGGLASLVACFLVEDPQSVVVWSPPAGAELLDLPGVPTDEHNTRAAKRQSDALAFGGCLVSPPLADLAPVGTAPAWNILARACLDAASAGCTSVSWPISCGADAGRLADAAEAARLVARLQMLPPVPGGKAPREPLEVTLPVADLDAQNLADLALDLDVPLQALWWRCPQAGHTPAGIDAGLAWDPVLRDVAASRGVIWDAEAVGLA